MLAEDALNAWTIAQGVNLDGIEAHRFPGRGIGVIAKRRFEAGDVALTVPTTFFRTVDSIDQSITSRLDGCSANAILAVGLMIDGQSNASPSPSPWHDILPTKQDIDETLPIMWPAVLQSLLPSAAIEILARQKSKLVDDWQVVSTNFPELQYDSFVQLWFTVSTRTFFYKTSEDDSRESDDCLALIPFADCFNHADAGCEVLFSPTEYIFQVDRRIEAEEEVFISYGNHNNDFLLVEYGFLLDRNRWDEVSLDEVILPLFSREHASLLQQQGYWGQFVLDGSAVCYRTQAALRILCMPLSKWQYGLLSGFDDEDEYQEAVDKLILDAIQSFQKFIRHKSSELHDLDEGLQCQRDVLMKRWEQIRCLSEEAVRCLRAEVSVVDDETNVSSV